MFWLRNNTKEYFSCLSLASFPITRQKKHVSLLSLSGSKLTVFLILSNSLSFHYICTSLRGSVPFEFCQDFYQLFSCLNRCFFFYTFFLRSVFSLSRLQEVTLFWRSRSHMEKKLSEKKIFRRTARNSGGARKVAPRSQSSTQRANVFFFFFFFFQLIVLLTRATEYTEKGRLHVVYTMSRNFIVM